MNKILLNRKLIIKMTILTLSMILICSTTVFATSADNEGVGLFNAIIIYTAEWVNRVGLAMAFYGAIQFLASLKSQNPEQKTNGMSFVAVGLMIAGVASENVLSNFGLIG